jgi:site-specific DNA recombinase
LEPAAISEKPRHGKRVSRLNPASEWITKGVPELRIISDELWDAAKLFSGLTKCGTFGSGFIMASANRLSCFGARYKGICDNRLTIPRDEVEVRVLKALQDRLLNQELFEEFCEEFTREMNRLRMQHRADLTAAEREIERIEVRRKKLVESIMNGVPASEVKDELSANALRREVLKAKLAVAKEPPPLLHPEKAHIYRTKVMKLAAALEEPASQVEAREALRGRVDPIVLTPDGSGKDLKIELRGNLAAMLGATVQTKRSWESDDFSLQVALVAGACNQRYLQLWSGAA